MIAVTELSTGLKDADAKSLWVLLAILLFTRFLVLAFISFVFRSYDRYYAYFYEIFKEGKIKVYITVGVG